MCLTIPAKIIAINGRIATVKNFQSTKNVNVSLFPDLKINDWILHTNDAAIKKISRQDAREIIDLLESHHPKTEQQKLSSRYKLIIENSKKRNLTEQEIVYLLNSAGDEKEALFAEADVMRKTYLKDFICVHGIIEFSNYCKNDCAYCGLRAENKTIRRYRMRPKEIVKTAVQAVKKKGYKLLVLQSGDDYFYNAETLVDIIKKIKLACRVFIFVSIGERDEKTYKKLKEAGAAGVLLRFETSNRKIFKKLHPQGKIFNTRLKLLKRLKRLGYFIATGSLVGLPGQTVADLARDILLINKLSDMATIGPFIPCDHTPLAKQAKGSIELTLKMIAALRLMSKTGRIPVTTAMETLAGEKIRKNALIAGANALMLNLTPTKYRRFYKIYPNKFHQEKNIWEKYGLFKARESFKMLEKRMRVELS